MKILLFLAILLVIITGLILWFGVAVEGEEKQMTATAEAQMKQILETTEPLIAFEARNAFTDESDIVAMNLSGSLYYKLTDMPGWESTPTWSSDGKIAFVAKGTSGKAEIFVRNLRTGKVWSLGVRGIYPAWSYDGTRIAYCIPQSASLWVMDINGNNRQFIVSNSGGRGIMCPRWSPDGTKILFLSVERDNGTLTDQIHIFDLVSGTRKALTEPAPKENWRWIEYKFADWSPDGAKIIYTTLNYDNGKSSIGIMDADGGNKIGVPVKIKYPGSITWSPGPEILFEDQGRGTGIVDVFTMRPDGSNLRNLTFSVLPINTDARDPAWFNPKFARVTPTPIPTYPPWDVNRDGVTDVADLVLLGKNWKKTGEGLLGDINSDGTVNEDDIFIWIEHFGEKTGENEKVLSSPALSPQNRKLLEAIKPELTKEQIAEIFRKLQPVVKPQGKKLTTWAEVKK